MSARMHRWARATAVAVAASLGAARPARAQSGPLCRPPTGSNEARLLAFFSVPLTFSPGDAPRRDRPGTVRLSGELSGVPEPAAHLQRTTYCYVGAVSKSRLSPVAPRPRLTVALPAGFAVEGSYVPPVTVGDARAHLGSLALSFARVVRRASDDPARGAVAAGAVTLLLRTHGTIGRIRGPMTCPKDALQQGSPTAPCYGTSPSSDTFRPNTVGAEGALGFEPRGGRVAVYAGSGVTRLVPRFQVGFRDGAGVTDRTRIAVDLTRASLFGGAVLRLGAAADVSAQLYSVPSDATVWRVALGYRLR